MKITPKLWMILLKEPEIEEVVGSGLLFKPQLSQNIERVNNNIGQVVALGELCFKGDRFKDSKTKLEIGDVVMFRAGAGARIKDNETNEWFRLITDTEVQAVLDDPNMTLDTYVRPLYVEN